MKKALLIILLAPALYPGLGFSAEVGLVVCAPGYPGSTTEAQPAMDAFAASISAAGGPEVSLAYFKRETEGLEALRAPEVHFVMTTLPFFLAHRKALELEPLAQAVAEGHEANQQWSLVAGKGRITKAADLEGWTIISPAGYSDVFVRAMVFDGWGETPENLKIVFSTRILTALKKAAGEDRVAVLLDEPQTASLGRLPFGEKLDIVRTGPSVPVSLICSIGTRASRAEHDSLATALLSLGSDPAAADAMAGIRMEKFIAVRREALLKAEEVFDRSAK